MEQVTVQKIGRTWTDLSVAASALLLLVAYSPSLLAGYWSPRAALALVLGAVGLPRLVSLYRSPLRLPALAATAFLAVASIAALASDDRRASLLGIFNWGTGWFFVAALVGAWAAGASTTAHGRVLIEQAVVAGVLVNVVLGVAEVAVDLSRFSLRVQGGRAPALLGNSVHLGAVAAAGTVFFASRVSAGRTRWLWAIGAAAAAVQVSGSRTALGVLAGVLIWVALRNPHKVSALVVAAAIVGLGGGSLATRIGGGAQETSSSRRLLVVESGGLGARLGVWEAAAKAIVHRPLLGAGPGRFRAATLARRSRAAAQAEGFDHIFVDAHNLLVEYATTTGLAGVACLLVWLFTGARRGSGPLLAVALALLAAHLLEPQAAATTPVAFLLLGAASTAGAASPSRPPLGVQVAVAVLAVLALFGAAHLLIGDWWLNQAHLDRRVSQGRHAVSVLPPWPVSALELSLSYVFTGQDRHDPSQFVAATHWLRVAVQRDRTDPTLWDSLADEELSDGFAQDAAAHYRQALRLDPWSLRARNGLGHVEQSLGHADNARQWFKASLALDPNQPGLVKELARLPG